MHNGKLITELYSKKLMREYWKILVVVIIYLIIGTDVQAQMLTPEKEKERIQLLKDVNKIKKDTNYVALCYKYGLFYEGIRNDSAVYYYERARDISRELGYISGQIRYYDYRSMVYIIESNYDTALLLMDTAYKMAVKHNSLRWQAIELNQQGTINQNKN